MDWKELEAVIEEDRIETNCVETMCLGGGVILPLVKMRGYDLFLWGMGANFDSILLYLKSNDMIVKGIISPDKESDFYNGIPVILPDALDKQDAQRTFVIVTEPDAFNDDRWGGVLRYASWVYYATKRKNNPVIRKYKQSYIKKVLGRYGLHQYYFLTRVEFKNICTDDSGLYYNRIRYYKSHLAEMKETYDKLYDQTSKETMVEFIRAFLQRGLYRTKECDGRNKYFAGYGRGESMEILYEHKEDEVWINCGASVGDNILLYLADGYRAKKIYAFEGSKAVYRTLCRNLRQLPEELRETVVPVNKLIAENTGWNSDIGEKISLINADIEGYELELLHSVKSIIRSDRPVIAICAYHRKEDLVEFPRFIDETVEDYRFLLRKYPSIGNNMRTSELVFYAIPQERLHTSMS